MISRQIKGFATFVEAIPCNMLLDLKGVRGPIMPMDTGIERLRMRSKSGAAHDHPAPVKGAGPAWFLGETGDFPGFREEARNGRPVTDGAGYSGMKFVAARGGL